VWLYTGGARFADPAAGRDADRLRLPGGSRPYVRAALPNVPLPGELSYDPQELALRIGAGQVSPVAREAWELTAGGVRVLEQCTSGAPRRASPVHWRRCARLPGPAP